MAGVKEMIRKIIYGIEHKKLIRRSVLIFITIICGAIAYEAWQILANRPAGSVTRDEVALIALFIGANGFLFHNYNKGRQADAPPKETENVDNPD